MRRALIYILLAVCLCLPQFLFAGQQWYGDKFFSVGDSLQPQKGNPPWQVFYIDTCTLHGNGSIDTLDFGTMLYNIRIKSLNGAAESSYCAVALPTRAIWHTSGTAVDLTWISFGAAAGAQPPDTSTVFIMAGTRYLYIKKFLGGDHDTFPKLQIKAMR